MAKAEEPKKQEPKKPVKPVHVRVDGYDSEPRAGNIDVVDSRVNATLTFPEETAFGNALSREVTFFVPVKDDTKDEEVKSLLVTGALQYAKSHGYGYSPDDVEVEFSKAVRPKAVKKK
mgnify:CR=1 FL=1